MRRLLLLFGCFAPLLVSGQSEVDSFPDIEHSYCSEGIGYPGGKTALDAYIKENLDFSGIVVEDLDVVFCRLLITEDGSVYKVEIQNTEHPEITSIITKSFLAMPNWEPYLHLGKPSERIVRIPVKINWLETPFEN